MSDHALRAYEAMAPSYDGFTAHHRYDEWTATLEELAREAGLRGRRLLDVACGTGKSFLPFLERGYEVTACDLSPRMAAIAAEKAAGRARVLVHDVRSLPLLGEFDLVCFLDDAVNYLHEPAELGAALRGLARNLAPGGVLVFDANTLLAYRTFFATLTVIQSEREVLVWDGSTPTDLPVGGFAHATLEMLRAAADGHLVPYLLPPRAAPSQRDRRRGRPRDCGPRAGCGPRHVHRWVADRGSRRAEQHEGDLRRPRPGREPSLARPLWRSYRCGTIVCSNSVRIASFNVENLFQRAVAMSETAGAAGSAAIVAQATLNEILRKATYTAADRERILQLLADLGIDRKDDAGPFAVLRQNRGQLVRRPRNKPPEIVARGRANWVGWVELKTEPVDEVATLNTARVIHELDADVQGIVEAESRHALRDFSRVMLRRVGGKPYEHSMLIQGNDNRGINVGLMTKAGFTFETMRTHIFDMAKPNQPVFSRDCAEYLIRTPAGAEVLVLVNHFKSKMGGGHAKRLAQSTRVKEIVTARLAQHPNLVVLGDLNDTPNAASLAPLLSTKLKDISTHPQFKDDGFPGTFGTQGARDKIDYVLLSPALMRKVTDGGIFRKGVFSASDRWPFFPTVTEKVHQASDHAAIWADIDLP